MPSQSSPANENRNPFAELLGITFTAVEEGSSFCTVEVHEDLLNPNRVLHGGVSNALADSGMAYALFASLDENLTCATIEIQLTYLRPVFSGTLSCKSWVVSRREIYASWRLKCLMTIDWSPKPRAPSPFCG